MKHLALIPILLSSSAWVFSQQTVTLKNVSIIDGTGGLVRRNPNLTISNGMIQSIGEVSGINAAAKEIDMGGHFIMPLMNNAHGHLGNVKDTTMSASNYTPENIRHQLQRYLSYGVGAVLSMGSEHPIGIKVRDSSRAGS